MKHTLILLSVLILTASSLLAETKRNLTVTVSEGSGSPAESYTVGKFINDPTFPIFFLGQQYIMKVYFSPDTDKEKFITFELEDPKTILPGGGTGGGSLKTIVNITFPYGKDPFEVFKYNGTTITAQVTEVKE